MFKKRRRKPFVSRMTDYMNKAMKGSYKHVSCAEEIKPMIKAFFKKSMSAKVNCKNCAVTWQYITNIANAVQYLAENTRNYERLSDEEIKSFGKIFEEFDALHAEALNLNQFSINFASKITCIREIVHHNYVGMHDSEEAHENWRDGMIFQNYEHLWKVIHRVNTEWEDLRSRGFSLSVFYEFENALNYDRSSGKEISEDEKIKNFMALLDGKMKFIPEYCHEYRLLGFKVVDNDDFDELVHTSDIKCSKSHRMRQKSTQCVVAEE